MNFDMILVVAGEDYKNLNVVIENSNKYINPSMIYIISPKLDIEKNKKNLQKFTNIFMIDENELIDINLINFDSYSLPGFPNRKFWYYQQFLKMAFSYSKYCVKDYYLIWDADTIPLANLNFTSKENKIYLTISNDEFHKEYFLNIKNLVNQKIKIYKKSFISQHLFVNKEHMVGLINKIGNIDNNKWIDKLLSKLEGHSQSLFSEYETYCNYVINYHTNDYIIRELNWFRYGDALIRKNFLKRDLDKLSRQFNYIAIEKNTTFKRRVKGVLKFYTLSVFYKINLFYKMIANSEKN